MIPTEEEIEEAYQEWAQTDGKYFKRTGFRGGAKWMLERLQPYLIEWIPVEDERKPEDRYPLVILTGYGNYYAFDGLNNFWSVIVAEHWVTHWARIPLPNQEK